MPARGYRKGISDAKAPLARCVRTRLPDDDRARLIADARLLGLTPACLLRGIMARFYAGKPLPAASPRWNSRHMSIRTPTSPYVRTRLTAAEHAHLAADAASRAITHSRLVRAIVRHHFGGTVLPAPRTSGATRQALTQLIRIANNLGQIDREARIRGRPYPRTFLAALRRRLAAIIREPGLYDLAPVLSIRWRQLGQHFNAHAHSANVGGDLDWIAIRKTMDTLDAELPGP